MFHDDQVQSGPERLANVNFCFAAQVCALQRGRPSAPGDLARVARRRWAFGMRSGKRERSPGRAVCHQARPAPTSPAHSGRGGSAASLCPQITAPAAPLPGSGGGGCAPSLRPRWRASPARGHFLRLSKRALSFLPNI